MPLLRVPSDSITDSSKAARIEGTGCRGACTELSSDTKECADGTGEEDRDDRWLRIGGSCREASSLAAGATSERRLFLAVVARLTVHCYAAF